MEGLVHDLNLTEKVDFITASLAKTFAGRAGIVFCPQLVAESLPYFASEAIFSSTLIPHEIVGLDKTLDIIKDCNSRRNVLHENSRILNSELKKMELNVPGQSHIISVIGGEPKNTEMLRNLLENQDIFGSMYCYPATPKDESLVRFSINSNLTEQNIQRILGSNLYKID